MCLFYPFYRHFIRSVVEYSTFISCKGSMISLYEIYHTMNSFRLDFPPVPYSSICRFWWIYRSLQGWNVSLFCFRILKHTNKKKEKKKEWDCRTLSSVRVANRIDLQILWWFVEYMFYGRSHFDEWWRGGIDDDFVLKSSLENISMILPHVKCHHT